MAAREPDIGSMEGGLWTPGIVMEPCFARLADVPSHFTQVEK